MDKDKFETIKRAIESRKPISFEYNVPDKIVGTRIGNPHALYIYRNKKNEETMKLDIVQTSGVTDHPEKPFPKWMGPISIELMENVKIEENLGTFEVEVDYNPDASPRYDFPIIKI